ncbi:MAG: carbohydrate kinase [Lentisphaeria bacterium]|nr:carbohydrate kinase [Lentisphaeria bacterium]
MSNLPKYIKTFSRLEVAVIGDLMLDKYIFGSATRISQEAPVPVVCVDSEKSVPGGAANVALNVLSLHAKAHVFGIVGTDAVGKELVELLKNAGAETDGIVKTSDRSTTVKTRIIASRQQVVRVDRENTSELSKSLHKKILDSLKKRLETFRLHAIIMEDYAKGVFTKEFMEDVVALARKHDVPVMLDPHPTHPFDVKGIRMMTPNRQEAFTLVKQPFSKETGNPLTDEPLLKVGDLLKSHWECDIPVITLGGEGMLIFQKGAAAPLHIPTRAQKVFDVSGAGDTVMAAMTLALLAGASPFDAAQIANYAAGIVVGIVGTAAIDYEALLSEIETDAILSAYKNKA